MSVESIKKASRLLIVFSILMIASNVLAAINWINNGFSNQIQQSSDNIYDPISFVFSIYFEMAITFVIIGIVSAICGIYIGKLKLWAHRFMSSILILFIAIIFVYIAVSLSVSIGNDRFDPFNIGMYIILILFSAPPTLLFWYLNRRKIKQHFV